MNRKAAIRRTTSETDIQLTLDLDPFADPVTNPDAENDQDLRLILETDEASGPQIRTGIGFLDHMLNLLARHGRFGLTVDATGDREVDCHHTVEDTGIVLGEALRQALGDRSGIRRYGHAVVPMDESLAMVTVDLSGRPFFVMNASFAGEKAGDMDTQTVEEFLRALAFHSAMNLHVQVVYGSNDHHKIEAVFKALAHALSEAVRIDPAIRGVLSTKGTLTS